MSPKKATKGKNKGKGKRAKVLSTPWDAKKSAKILAANKKKLKEGKGGR